MHKKQSRSFWEWLACSLGFHSTYAVGMFDHCKRSNCEYVN